MAGTGEMEVKYGIEYKVIEQLSDQAPCLSKLYKCKFKDKWFIRTGYKIVNTINEKILLNLFISHAKTKKIVPFLPICYPLYRNKSSFNISKIKYEI